MNAGKQALRLLRLIPISLSLLMAVLWICSPLPLQTLRNNVFDQYQRWQPRSYQKSPVRIIDIDDASLQRVGQWPWPRSRLADLVNKLGESQPAVIVFDLMLAEADRTSPQALLDLWGASQELRAALSVLPDHDQLLAQALQQHSSVLGFTLQSSGPDTAAPVAHGGYWLSGFSPLPFMHNFSQALAALPALEQAAEGYGALNFVADADGVVRRVPLMLRMADKVLPTLTSEALRIAEGVQNLTLHAAEDGLTAVEIGHLSVPTTEQAEVWLHYSQPAAERSIPAWQVLSGLIPQQQLAGNILLIGTSAQGVMDKHLNPLAAVTPGVEIYAQALEQILAGNSLSRPPWVKGLELLALLLGCGLMSNLALRKGIAVSALAMLSLLVLMTVVAWLAFSRFGLLLDFIIPFLAIALSFVVSIVVRQLSIERRQRWIKATFARYVSPNLVEYLLAHPEELELQGHRRECSFVFTDLVGFTRFMEKIDPAQAVGLLNSYLDQVIAIAFAHQGTLDRIVGDEVAILFSAPIAQADHRLRALRCALEIHAFTRCYAEQLQQQGLVFGQTHIGVHSGEVIVGNVGGSQMFDYRALGDAVNTASRLQGANKYLGTSICVSADVLADAESISARPIGKLLLKGKSLPIMVYEPLLEGLVDEAYAQAYQLLVDGNASAARTAFEQLAEQRRQDPLVELHL